MSFYFYLLIFDEPRHSNYSLQQIGTDRPLLSVGCMPSTFFSCAPLKSFSVAGYAGRTAALNVERPDSDAVPVLSDVPTHRLVKTFLAGLLLSSH